MSAPPGWDEAAAWSPRGHVMQSTAWARIRRAQGWRAEYVRGERPLPCALVLWRPLAFGQRLAYVPRGPVIEPGDAEGLRRILEQLAERARRGGAVFLKVDPELDPADAAPALAEAGFRRGPDIQPVLATLELALGRDDDALLATFEKDTRWSVRQATKRGVVVRVAEGDADLRTFHALYAETGSRAGFITRTAQYYRSVWGTLIAAGLATLRLAEHGGRAVAGAITWRCGERELYMYGASNEAGRRCYASYLLQWECIRAARDRGAARYDFGGIPLDPERTDDPMRGPYLFKKGFGGQPRRFVGAHDAVARPLAYRAFLMAEPLYTRALQALGRRRRD
jgi:peptidoglycan pentaglycine glycine transferase (the first glycine)